MAIWQLRVNRYDSDSGEARLSGVRHINADDFAAAATRAYDIVEGMKSADPQRKFRIAHLATQDYRGEDCEGGIYPFETREEMSARLAPETGQ